MSGEKDEPDLKEKGLEPEAPRPERKKFDKRKSEKPTHKESEHERGRWGKKEPEKPDFDELEFDEPEFDELEFDEQELEVPELEEIELDELPPQTLAGPEIKGKHSMEGGNSMEEDFSDEEWEESQAVSPRMVAVILAGLFVLAAVICAILWNITHSDKGNADNPSKTEVEDMEDQSGQSEDQIGQGEGPAGGNQFHSGGGDESGSQSQPGGADESGNQSQPGDQDQAGAQALPEDQEQEADPPQSDSPGQDAEGQGQEVTMSFAPVQESVTAKDATNLRSQPSTLNNETIVVQISNGEVITRTGVNSDTGWSRVEYNGQILYAVSQLLTTDLSYKPPVQPADPNRVVTAEGRVVIFSDCDDNVSPKMYVNLRLEPSTAQGNDSIHCQISSDQTVHRTGWSEDAGWSRVEYDGQTLYVVTSFVNVKETQ